MLRHDLHQAQHSARMYHCTLTSSERRHILLLASYTPKINVFEDPIKTMRIAIWHISCSTGSVSNTRHAEKIDSFFKSKIFLTTSDSLFPNEHYYWCWIRTRGSYITALKSAISTLTRTVAPFRNFNANNNMLEYPLNGRKYKYTFSFDKSYAFCSTNILIANTNKPWWQIYSVCLRPRDTMQTWSNCLVYYLLYGWNVSKASMRLVGIFKGMTSHATSVSVSIAWNRRKRFGDVYDEYISNSWKHHTAKRPANRPCLQASFREVLQDAAFPL